VDRARTEYALLYAKDLHLEQPELAGRPFLNAVSARVKEIFRLQQALDPGALLRRLAMACSRQAAAAGV